MRRVKAVVGIGVAAALLVATAGCATRGYVRKQVAGLKAEMGSSDTDLRAGIDEASRLADEAGTKAAGAANASEQARLMALGRVGFHEVERYRVYFASNDIDPNATSALDVAAEKIASHPEYLVEIYGYTDAKGSDSYNFELSRKRAESIRRLLVERAPGQLSRFYAIGFGEGAPSSEVGTLGEGADRRQAVIVLIERTAPDGSTQPITEMQDGPR